MKHDRWSFTAKLHRWRFTREALQYVRETSTIVFRSEASPVKLRSEASPVMLHLCHFTGEAFDVQPPTVSTPYKHLSCATRTPNSVPMELWFFIHSLITRPLSGLNVITHFGGLTSMIRLYTSVLRWHIGWYFVAGRWRYSQWLHCCCCCCILWPRNPRHHTRCTCRPTPGRKSFIMPTKTGPL